MSANEVNTPRMSAIEGAKVSGSKSVEAEKLHKLHLVFNPFSEMRFEWLKDQIKAQTDVEVIRRALGVYEFFEPDDLSPDDDGADAPQTDTSAVAPTKGRERSIKIPAWVKQQLDEEKQEHGRPYSETIRHALRVLEQLVRERNAMRERLLRASEEERATERLSDADKFKIIAMI